MSNNQPEKVTATEMIKYIDRNVNDLMVEERKEILGMIMSSSIESNKIQTKGDGTQIKYRDIPPNVITSIYHFIKNKLAAKMAALEYFPDCTDAVGKKS